MQPPAGRAAVIVVSYDGGGEWRTGGGLRDGGDARSAVPGAVAVVLVNRAEHVCKGHIGHGYPAALHLHQVIVRGNLQRLQRLDAALSTASNLPV